LLLLASTILSSPQLSSQTVANPFKPTTPALEITSSAHGITIVAEQGKSAADSLAAACPDSASAASYSLSHEWQAEWVVGKKLAAEIEEKQRVIDEPAITEYLNGLEQTIVRSAGLRGCFVVKLLEDDDANAFSLPGGFLYVTSGLALVADNEGELTAALAHETAHVTARHFARIDHKRRIWGRVVLAGGPAGYMIRYFMGPLLTRKLIRNSEFEADRLCFKYQSASGYDPRDFSRLLHDALQDYGKPESFVDRLFDTHPLITTRVKRLDKLADRLPPAIADYKVETSSFNEFKQRLQGLLNVR
jgi:predicted Zn-dependent protease